MEKNCLTCKNEPDWKTEFDGGSWAYGKCKKVPLFFQEGSLRKDLKDVSILFEIGGSCGNFHENINCNLWEAKDD